MTTLLSQARSAVSELTAAKVAYDRATDQREIVYTDLPKLATRLLNALAVSGASTQTIDNVRTIVRRIKGYVSADRPPIPSEAVAVAKRRARGLDYASQLGNWAVLLEMLEAEAKYRPAERELRIATLKTTLSAMRAQSTAVNQAMVVLEKALQERDRVLYTQPGNLFEVSALAKGYVKSVYGTSHAWYKSAAKIRFTKYK